MATRAEELALQVTASTELAVRELAAASRAVQEFQCKSDIASTRTQASFDKVGTAAAGLRGAVGGVVGAFGAFEVLQFGRSLLSFADDLEAAAEQAGINVERYQTLRQGLRALEVDAQKSEQVFERLANTLGEVQGGTAGEGVIRTLDRMGITARILSGEISTTDGLLDAIAESAGRFGTQAEFVAAVVDIVGRKVGVDLANALSDSGVALKEQEAAFKATGAVISEEYIAELASADQAIEDFVEASRGRLAIWLADTINFFKAAEEAAQRFAASLPFAGPETVARANALAQPSLIDELFGGETGSSAPRIRGQSPAFTGGSAFRAVAGRRAPARSSGARGGSSRSAGRARGTTSGGIDEFAAYLGDAAIEARNLSVSFEDALAASQRLTQDSLRGIVDGLTEGNTAIDDFNDKLRESQDFARDFAATFEGAFETALLDGRLGDALTGLLDDLATMIIRLTVIKPLAESIASSLGGGGGLGGLLSGIVTSVFGGARANGGPVTGGRAYLVGERGPELFVPKVSGAIAPNSSLGSSVTVNIDARGAGDPAAVRLAARQAVLEAAPALVGLSSASTRRDAARPRLPGGR